MDERVKEDRSLLVYVLLGFVTCGIYSFYFLYKFIKDLNTVCEGDGKNTPNIFLVMLYTILTCGIYAFYFYYSMGNRLADNAPRYGKNFEENGTTVLLWMIFGSLLCGIGSFVAMNILFKNMNELARAYNFGSKGNMGAYDNRAGQNEYQYGTNYENQQYQNPQYQNPQYQDQQYQNPQHPSDTPYRAVPQGVISCIAGAYQGNQVPINSMESIVVGRSSQDANLVLEGTKLSRRHCVITYYDDTDTYGVTDYSSNGTFYMNGSRFVALTEVRLQPGTQFYLGNRDNIIQVG
ncbi:MAG: DUF4234 domain-containing protein [Clostridia bacterium]|nr:DUF4234 domain-containing protein [Clostridia bacterium]NCC42256.1 DUF4234 domain-containing protein [Clostridia bacterium]